MRVCQGLGAGAEFGGASTLLAEHAPKHKRGFYGSFSQLGVQIGLVLGTAVVPARQPAAGGPAQRWGWRLPFLASFLMIFVTLYFRLRVEESPVFEQLRERKQVVKLPVLETVKRYPKSVLVGIGAHVADVAVIYIYVAFSVAYATDELELSSTTVLLGIVLAALIGTALQPVYGALSDRIGRRPLNLWSVCFTALYAFPFWLLINTGEPVVICLAIAIGLAVGLGPMIAVQGAFYAELFGANVRYTGFAGSRELGAALVGFSPTLSAALLGWGGGDPWLVAAWMIFACLVSLVAFLASEETKDLDIGLEKPAQDAHREQAQGREGGAVDAGRIVTGGGRARLRPDTLRRAGRDARPALGRAARRGHRPPRDRRLPSRAPGRLHRRGDRARRRRLGHPRRRAAPPRRRRGARAAGRAVQRPRARPGRGRRHRPRLGPRRPARAAAPRPPRRRDRRPRASTWSR